VKLDLAPPPKAGEPPTAYASRIAVAHGLLVKELCRDFSIRYSHLINGAPSAIGKLAAIGGASEADLTRFAFVRTGIHAFRHRRQTVRRENLTDGRLKVCPQCLIEDIKHRGEEPAETAVFCRAEWYLDVVDTCRVHHTAMVTIHKGKGSPFSVDFSNVMEPKVVRLQEMVLQAESRLPTGLQDYVLARLDGRETRAPFLDTMDLPAAIQTCEMLGTAACFGRKVERDNLDPSRLRTARIRGFEIGSEGEEGIGKLLKDMMVAYSRRRVVEDGQFARQAFSVLHNYLFVGRRPSWKDVAFAPLRTVVGDFIKANFPLGAGDVVFGEVIRERKLHSVTSLGREIGFGPPRVTKLLRLKGLISDDQAGLAPQNIVFDAKKATEAVRESLAALPYRGAAKYLGTGLHQVCMLAGANFIEPIASGPLGLRATFAPAMLDAFVARLLRRARPVQRMAAHHVTLQQAALKATCTQADVVKLILGGKLKWVGTLGRKRDYRSILVDLSEVRLLVHGLDPQTISPLEFAKRFDFKKEVAHCLVKHGHVKAVACERAGHQVTRIPLSEAESFRRSYVSLGELSRASGRHHVTVKKALDQKGIRPAFDPDKVVLHFYRRRDVSR